LSAPKVCAPQFNLRPIADRANRKIEKSQALELSYNLGCNYVEASAKSGMNVSSIFHDLVAELRGMKKEIEVLGELEVPYFASNLMQYR
jgi:hypothetical protein